MKSSSFVHNGTEYSISPALGSNPEEITQILNASFAMWTTIGVKKQSVDEVMAYMGVDGFVIRRQPGDALCAIVCLRSASPRFDGSDIIVDRAANRSDRATLLNPVKFKAMILDKQLLYSYALGVKPELAKEGLGLAILKAIYDWANANKIDGFLLETGKASTWLVEWYQRLGFYIIGEGIRSGTSIQTVMMFKKAT